MSEKQNHAIVLANARPSFGVIHNDQSDWALDAENMLRKVAAQNLELLNALQAMLEAEPGYEYGGFSAEELTARELAVAAIAKYKGE